MLCTLILCYTDNIKHDFKLYEAIWETYNPHHELKSTSLYRNLLPFDVEHTENQQTALKDWTNSLRKQNTKIKQINVKSKRSINGIKNQIVTKNKFYPSKKLHKQRTEQFRSNLYVTKEYTIDRRPQTDWFFN